MPNPLSTFGVIHTAISLVGVAIGFIALFQDGKIAPKTKNGRLYGIFTVLACLSSFLVMKTGHLSSAHNLSFLILILLLLFTMLLLCAFLVVRQIMCKL